MNKAIAGFLIGFFLATGLFFSFVYYELGPLEQDIQSAIPIAKAALNASKSSLYQTAEEVVLQVSDLAKAVESIPFIGAMAEQVSENAGTLSELLAGYKEMAEKIVPTLEFTLFLVQVSIPAIILSILGIALGAFLLFKK